VSGQRNIVNRGRDLSAELSLRHPLFLQFYFLINDIQEYLKKIPEGKKILDIGCGTKPYQKFVNSNVEYIGVDIDVANKDVDIYSSAYNIDIEECSIDYVVSFQVLEHLEEPLKMLEEAYRVLKEEGEIYLTVPMSEHLHEEPYDFFRYTEHGLIYLLKKAGFKQVKIIRMGTNSANIGRRIAQALFGRKFIRILIPIVNYVFFRLEKRRGSDVMNYGAIAKK
jgi:SAM-dependent methyltransferase